MQSEQSDVAIDISHVDVLFGEKRDLPKALQELDANGTRESILEHTGVVLGVADASLQVPKGSISVLMGLSGSGKSSLLRCVNGLNPITRGAINIASGDTTVNVAALDSRGLRHLRRNTLAMVFQQFGLLPWASVRDNIAFGLRIRGESEAKIKQTVDQQLATVSLESWADHPIHMLSGGMQQRVGLARAFATDADILLMDEPFSALDPLIREHLQDELLALQQRLKKTILFVSHDLDEALKIGNQISIMESGKVVQTGTAEDIVFSPNCDYVQRFVANINPLSVLKAKSLLVALPLRDGKADFPEQGLRLSVEEGELREVLHNGAAMAVEKLTEQVEEPSGSRSHSENVLVIASPETPIKLLLQQAAQSPFPTLIMDEGKVLGMVTQQALIAALAKNAVSTKH